MIQTVDFFTPVVDDPYTFGQIAAANSLSDVYAMGGEPKIALNVVGFPNCLDPSILADILRGGAEKKRELFLEEDILFRIMNRSMDCVFLGLCIRKKYLKIMVADRGMH